MKVRQAGNEKWNDPHPTGGFGFIPSFPTEHQQGNVGMNRQGIPLQETTSFYGYNGPARKNLDQPNQPKEGVVRFGTAGIYTNCNTDATGCRARKHKNAARKQLTM